MLLPLVTVVPRLVVVVVVTVPGVGHGLVMGSRVRLVTRVRRRREAARILRNVHDAGGVGRQGRRCGELRPGAIVAGRLEAVGLQDVGADPWGEGLRAGPAVHSVVRAVRVVVVHVGLVGVRVVIVAGGDFITVTVLVTRAVVVGQAGLVAVAVAVVKAGSVFVTLIVGRVLVVKGAVV